MPCRIGVPRPESGSSGSARVSGAGSTHSTCLEDGARNGDALLLARRQPLHLSARTAVHEAPACPRSPTSVAYLSGNSSMNSAALASCAARSICGGGLDAAPCGAHVCHGRVRHGIRNVFGDGAGKQHGLLTHHTNLQRITTRAAQALDSTFWRSQAGLSSRMSTPSSSTRPCSGS